MIFIFQRDNYNFRLFNIDLNIKYQKLLNSEYEYKVNYECSRNNKHIKTFSIFLNEKEVKCEKEVLSVIEKELEGIKLEYLEDYGMWKTTYATPNIRSKLRETIAEKYLGKSVYVFDSRLLSKPYEIV